MVREPDLTGQQIGWTGLRMQIKQKQFGGRMGEVLVMKGAV